MDIKTLMKLSLMGLLALSFAAPMAYAKDAAEDDDTEEEAPKKKKAKKGKKKASKAQRMFVTIEKFKNQGRVPDDQFELIRTRVQQCTVGTRKFEVVELEQLKTIIDGQGRAASGITDGDDPAAPEAGKVKAAGFYIYGNVLYCGKDEAGASAEGVVSAKSTSKVELQIKITNAESGKILTEKSVIGYGIDKAIATDSFKSATGQGMRDAIDEACHMAVDALRDVAYPAKIISVNDDDVIINMTNEEVKEGDVFDVIDAKDLGNDEDTGAWLGLGGKTIGRVKISSSGSQTSNAEPTKGKKGKVLDLEDLDTDDHMYILRRVSKAKLKKEAKDEHQNNVEALEGRF